MAGAMGGDGVTKYEVPVSVAWGAGGRKVVLTTVWVANYAAATPAAIEKTKKLGYEKVEPFFDQTGEQAGEQAGDWEVSS